jgi:hypothetical protein
MGQKSARDWWIPTQFMNSSAFWQIGSIAQVLGGQQHLFDGLRDCGGSVKIGMTS